jgi:hypothetical protein
MIIANLEQMRMLLQDYHVIPIALREEGATDISCPFCSKMHYNPGPPGHHVTGCDADEWQSIMINERSFVPPYGYTIYEYEDTSLGVRELVMTPHLEPPIWTEMQKAWNNI